MVNRQEHISVPRYWKPWPFQQQAWQRLDSGQFTYYFHLWARQLGKDTTDIQWNNRQAWDNPGTQAAYIGLDNVWITNNIFKKYVDGRTFWQDYPEDMIDVKETAKEVYMLNNPENMAPARTKFIGFLNDQQLIGSSYDRFIISEGSLYEKDAFQFLTPIWDRKLSMNKPLRVVMNGTPRGMRNVMYDMMRTYSGVDDPEDFPGAHGNCYIDKVTIDEAMIPDGHGGLKKLYTPEEIEVLEDRYIRQFGNLNFFNQENRCDFTTVNAGLVYMGIEQLMNEKRFCKYNLDTTKPVYMAWDISSKGKTTDSSAAIIYQYYNGQMFIYDIYEKRGQSLVQCVSDLSEREYFKYIRFAALPWDSDRSASSETPIEECRNMWPSINWHALEKERVDRGIHQVRQILPNMIINSENCDWLIECFNHYEYGWLKKAEDWSATPVHNRYSHLMDALRYAVMGINEISYLKLNATGADPDTPPFYKGWDDKPERIVNPWNPLERRLEDTNERSTGYSV